MSNGIYYWMDCLSWHPGFFCSYQSIVGFLDFIEKEPNVGYKVWFESGLYFDAKYGLNWWEYYFEPIEGGSYDTNTTVEHVGDMLKSKWNTDAISVISRDRAAELINKYIKLKLHMKNKIDYFISCNFKEYTIGIHYRGTDKSSEARRVGFEEVKNEVIKVIGDRTNYIIFVATDEQIFINYMKAQFGDKVVYTSARRSTDNGTPIHHKDGKIVPNRYQLGEEAVIDCYLLSRCDILIRTHSNLSSSAANINPTLPIINLNVPLYCNKGLR